MASRRFAPVGVYWNNPYTFFGYTTADFQGSVTGPTAFRITVPSGAHRGTNYVYAQEQGGKPTAVGTFTVE